MVANRGLPLTEEFDGLVKVCAKCAGSGTILVSDSTAYSWLHYEDRDLCPACHGRAFVIETDQRRPRWNPAPLTLSGRRT